MNLTLENINPEVIDVDLIGECVVAAASVLAPDDNFDVVIAGDFISTIRSRAADERDRDSYATDRTFGEAAARALTDLDPPTIVVHAGFVVQGGDREAALETFEHESLHVLTSRRGESLNDVRRRHQISGRARGSFVAMAGVAAEEFRVVRALRQTREALAADFKRSLATSLDAFLKVIWKASDARTAGGTVESYCESVMTAFSSLVVMLAYLAAAESVEFESDAPPWDRWVVRTWPRLHELFNKLPPASEQTDVELLDAVVFEVAKLLPDLLADIGFALEDTDPERGAIWFGPI